MSDASIRQLAPRGDPTRTLPLANRYAQRLRGQLGHLNAAIRRGVEENDIFGLRPIDTLQPVPDPPPFRFETDQEKVELFMRWLNEQIDRGILEVVGTEENPFIRSAYSRSVQDADTILNAQGVTVPETDLEAVFNTPVHQRALEGLFTRNFENLTDITDDMAGAIREELTQGFARGINPNEMARNITGRVDAIGKHRATVLARTETINAYSTGTLNRYEDFGVTRVTVRAEFLTAGDDRVCPLCASLEGETVTIDTARNGTWEFTTEDEALAHLEGTYPFSPPVHPQCRCRWIPSVS